MDLPKAQLTLQKVNLALEHLGEWMEQFQSEEQAMARRRHPRYERRELVSRLHFMGHSSIQQDRVFVSPVRDVSAEGMGLIFPPGLAVKKGDRLRFVVLRSESHERIIGGKGKIVRVCESEDEWKLGIQFMDVSSDG